MLKSHVARILAMAAVVALMPATAASEQEGRKSESIDISYESDTVVRMGDVVITHADLDAHMAQLPERDRTQAVSSMERVDKLLQNLLLQKALFEQARDHDLLEQDATAAQAAYRIMTALAEEQMNQHIESRLLDDYEARARELFLADPERFESPPQSYDFTHVLISTAERDEAQAMRLILELHDRVQAGESLDSIASEYTDDEASREAGGSYENHPLNRLDRNFARALAALEEPGAVSGPVRSRFGWHLIRLDERHGSQTREWEDVKEQAMEFAREEHAERIRKAYMSELLDMDEIQVTPGSIERFQKRHGYDAQEARQALQEAG